MIIYKATNNVNGKIYIGQTNRPLKRRISGHKCCAMRGSTLHFHNALRKYGIDLFEWEVIYECDSKEELDKMEMYYIEQYNSINEGYNRTIGGDDFPVMKGKDHPMYGKTHSDDSKEKISKNHHNVSGKNNPMYGKTGSNNPKSISYIGIDPNGIEHHFTGLLQFCRDNNLIDSNVCRAVKTGGTHKKWRFIKKEG